MEENFEGLSWQYILDEDKIIPDLVVLTEPSNMEIKIGQLGRMEMKVIVPGVSSHGSAPEKGQNAIYKMIPIIKEIDELNAKLRPRPNM